VNHRQQLLQQGGVEAVGVGAGGAAAAAAAQQQQLLVAAAVEGARTPQQRWLLWLQLPLSWLC
jgi:hypothetical protein